LSKYKAEKIVFDGINFDSKDEAEYYKYLLRLKAESKIINFELQPKYTLISAFKKFTKSYAKMTYTPDYLVYHLDGSLELIDVKGFSTQQGEMRKKLFDFYYPDLKLTWMAKSIKYGVDGWIEYEKLQKIRRENKKNVK